MLPFSFYLLSDRIVIARPCALCRVEAISFFPLPYSWFYEWGRLGEGSAMQSHFSSLPELRRTTNLGSSASPAGGSCSCPLCLLSIRFITTSTAARPVRLNGW